MLHLPAVKYIVSQTDWHSNYNSSIIRIGEMVVAYDDGGDEPAWSGTTDEVSGFMVPVAPAPKTRSPQREMVGMVDLEKLLKGPIDEVYRNNSPGMNILSNS